MFVDFRFLLSSFYTRGGDGMVFDKQQYDTKHRRLFREIIALREMSLPSRRYHKYVCIMYSPAEYCNTIVSH